MFSPSGNGFDLSNDPIQCNTQEIYGSKSNPPCLSNNSSSNNYSPSFSPLFVNNHGFHLAETATGGHEVRLNIGELSIDDVSIAYDNGTLTILGGRRIINTDPRIASTTKFFQTFSHSLFYPGIDAAAMTRTVADGVLTVNIPQRQATPVAAQGEAPFGKTAANAAQVAVGA